MASPLCVNEVVRRTLIAVVTAVTIPVAEHVVVIVVTVTHGWTDAILSG